jgi:hypothetical protein
MPLESGAGCRDIIDLALMKRLSKQLDEAFIRDL